MKDTKFTNGPWFIENNFCTLDVSSKDNGIVCSVECGYQLSEQLIDPSDEEQANAHLITAAPDMYALLVELVKSVENDCSDFSMFAVKSLLSKARGES